jgi:hypothetical protein
MSSRHPCLSVSREETNLTLPEIELRRAVPTELSNGYSFWVYVTAYLRFFKALLRQRA